MDWLAQVSSLRVSLVSASSCTIDGLVGTGQLTESLIGIGQLLLKHASISISLLKKSLEFFQIVVERVSFALPCQKSILLASFGVVLILKLGLHIPNAVADSLDILLSFSIGSIGMLQISSKVKHISLKFLLNTAKFNLGLGFRFKSHLHAINSLRVILSGVGKLDLLLINTACNFLFDLLKLKSSTKNLVFSLFKDSLSLRKCSLELKLLSLKSFPDFVNFMDRSSTLSDAVHDILDLNRQGFVFSAHLIKLND